MKDSGKVLTVLLLALLMLIGMSGISLADEAVTNGNFNGATGWTFTTTVYDAGSTNTADGSGSGTINATGKNITSNGTITESIAIPGGSTINAATDVVAFAQQQWTLSVKATQTVVIALRYADLTTVEVFNGTAATGSSWTALTNATATVFPLTLAQNVDQVIITLSTGTGATNSSTSDLWVDDVSITFAPAAAGNTLTSCADCHTYPPTDAATRNATGSGEVVGSHTVHAYVCNTCHVIPASETSVDFAHRNGDIQMKTIINDVNGDTDGSYSKGAAFAQANDINGTGLGSCSNVDCHYNQATPTWGSSGGTTCETCHNNGAGEPWPAVGAHDAHLAALGATGVDSTNSAAVMAFCDICHTGAGSGTAAHADGNKYDVSIPATYDDQSAGTPAYSGGAAGTCSDVSCHGGQATPIWSTGTIDVATQCASCHKLEVTATEYNSGTSGMHGITTAVSGKQHGVDYGCSSCHAGAPINHFAGLDTTATDTVDNMVAGITIGASPALTTCAMACHKDGGDWKRLNDKTKAIAADLTRCDTCHGGVNGAGTWTFGTGAHNAADGSVEHEFDWDGNATPEVRTQHSTCKTCHGWNDPGDTSANYDLTNEWNQGGPDTTMHGDGLITLNGPDSTPGPAAGTQYDDTAWGCLAACHQGAANAGHYLEDSGFTVGYGDFGAGGDCLGCHNSTNTNIPANPVAQFTGSTHSHIASPTAADCSVCHHSNQSMSGASPNVISLRNADTGAEILYDQTATDRGDLVTFCLSCHDANGATNSYNATDGTLKDATHPFSNDALVPDISQYWQGTTYNSHNYGASANTVPAKTKARSAHGFPGTNVMKQDSQATYTNAQPVSCLECHPAHGSNTGSPQLTSHAGGAGPDGIDFGLVGNKMVKTGYAEPGTCWSCHDTAGVKDYYGDNTSGGHWTGTHNSEYAYKQHTFNSTHEVDGTGKGFFCSPCHNPHGGEGASQYYTPLLRGSWMTSPYLEDSACKLVGTQIPVTYQANTPQSPGNHQGPRVEPTPSFNKPPQYGNGYGASGGQGHTGWYLDENTFGFSGVGWGRNTGTVTPTRISETADQFGGLCANCHAGNPGTGGTVTAMKTAGLIGKGLLTNWGAEIHHTVKGWAATDPGKTFDVVNPTNNPNMHQYQSADTNSGMWVDHQGDWYSPEYGFQWGAYPTSTNQMASAATAYHQFPCSKCHTPHASGLPRLMVTNCLDVGTSTTQRQAHGTNSPAWSYPTWGLTGWSPVPATYPLPGNVSELAMHCHNKRSTNTNGGGGWNKVTGTITW